MKSSPLFLAGAALLTAAGLLLLAVPLLSPQPPSPPPPDLRQPGPDGSTLTTTFQPALIFQKAFWRHPAPDDLILHAERREWTTAPDGIRHWQWFIACRPGPAMQQWIASNPFSLSPPTGPPSPGSPAPSGSSPPLDPVPNPLLLPLSLTPQNQPRKKQPPQSSRPQTLDKHGFANQSIPSNSAADQLSVPQSSIPQSSTSPIPSPPPPWFPENLQGYQIRTAPHGSLLWLTTPDRALLYATDRGQGFTPPRP